MPLAPQLFNLLQSNRSSWVTIRIVRLFGILAPTEPRLAKKLYDPFRHVLTSSDDSSSSVLIECIYTVMSGMAHHRDLLLLSFKRLTNFVTSKNQNLRFLALKALLALVTQYPDGEMEGKDELILHALTDRDTAISRYAAEDSGARARAHTHTHTFTRSSFIATEQKGDSRGDRQRQHQKLYGVHECDPQHHPQGEPGNAQ